jgi:hypothetical protein
MRQLDRARRAVLGWPADRHSLVAELAVVVALYALYEATRGLVVGDRAAAIDHARTIAGAERSLHLFGEAHVQAAAGAVPGLIGTLGTLYLTLHLTVTGLYLVWLHRRRPEAYPVVRNALLLASGLALVGFLAFPTAPPRLAALGIADTISHGRVDLNHGLVSALYNPYAAVPSMHIAYAAIVGASLYLYGGGRLARVLAFLYPMLQLLVIVATGNHFFFDAATGAAVAALALPIALRLPHVYGAARAGSRSARWAAGVASTSASDAPLSARTRMTNLSPTSSCAGVINVGTLPCQSRTIVCESKLNVCPEG